MSEKNIALKKNEEKMRDHSRILSWFIKVASFELHFEDE